MNMKSISISVSHRRNAGAHLIENSDLPLHNHIEWQPGTATHYFMGTLPFHIKL